MRFVSQSAQAADARSQPDLLISSMPRSSGSSPSSEVPKAGQRRPLLPYPQLNLSLAQTEAHTSARRATSGPIHLSTHASKPVKPSHPQHFSRLAPPLAPTFRATITVDQLGPYSPSAPLPASHHLESSYLQAIPSHLTPGSPSFVEFGNLGKRPPTNMSAGEIGSGQSSIFAPDTQGLTTEFGRNERKTSRAISRSAEQLGSHASRQGAGVWSRVGDSVHENNAEKSSLSFFKRPIRMKRDKKGPPPPVNTQHVSSPINSAGNDRLSVPSLSPRGISQTSPKAPSSRESPLSSLIKKSPLTPAAGRKLNTLLTAAARTIRSGDSKVLETYQASQPVKSVLVPRDIRRPPQPWQHDHIPTFPNSLKRIPVPAYEAIDIDDASLRPDTINRTASYDRNRHARPRTAESKHSRTSSLPVNQGPFALDCLNMQDHGSVSQPNLNVAEPSASAEVQLPLYPPIQLPQPTTYNGSDYLSTAPTRSASPDLRHAPHGSREVITRTRERPPTLCYDDFRELVSQAMGRPLSGSYTASSKRLSTLSESASARSRTADSRASVAGAAQISDQYHRKDLSLDAGLSASYKYQANHLSNVKQTHRHSYQSIESSRFSCPPEENLLLSKGPSNTPTPEVGPDKAPITRTAKIRPWSMASPFNLGVEEIRNRSPNAFSSFKKPAFRSSRASPSTSDGEVFVREPRASTRLHMPTSEKFQARRTLSTFELRKPPNNSRHSFHFLPIPTDLSPLERVTDPRILTGSLSLADLITQHHQRPGRAARCTPSVTHPTENLMFAVRGEIYGPGGEQASLPGSPYKSHEGLEETVHAPGLPTFNRRASNIQANGNMSILLEDSDEESHRMSAQFGTEAVDDDLGQSCRRSNVTDSMMNSLGLKPRELPHQIELKDIALVNSGGQTFNQVDSMEAAQVKGIEQALSRESMLRQGSSIQVTEDASGPLNTDPIQHDEVRGSGECSFDRLFTHPNSPGRSESVLSSTSDGETSRLENGGQLRSSLKTISAETSLEMAASILGQPVPAVSREIWKSFERIHMQLEGRSLQTEEEELRWMLGRLFESSAQKPSTDFVEAAVQTDPTEAVIPAHCDLVSGQLPALQTGGTPRSTETVERPTREIDQVETERAEELSGDSLRQSCRSEQSFKTTLRESPVGIQSYGNDEPKISQSSWEQHFPVRTYSTRAALVRRRVSETSEPNQDASPHRTVRSPTKAYRHPAHSVYFPIGQLREAIRLEPHTSLLNQNSSSSSVLSAGAVLEALDSALEAEEAFQREKHHLQSVARRQSQTIEGLLVDKEVLTLEVARLTGLVELLARDHNLLNERIDKAEQAFDDMQATASGHQPRQISSAESARHCRALGQPDKQDLPRVSPRLAATSMNTRLGGVSSLHPNLSEFASGEESGELEQSQGGSKDDGEGDSEQSQEGSKDEGEGDSESLCDPEQPSMVEKSVIVAASPSSLPSESASGLGSADGGSGSGVVPLTASLIAESYPILPVVSGLEA